MALVCHLLDRPIAFNPALVQITGRITSALLLSQMIYWQKKRDGWFYKTAAEFQKETGLTRSEFESARRLLVSAKPKPLIAYQVRGVPAKGYYKVEFEALIASLQESCNVDFVHPANCVAEDPQSALQDSSNLLTSEILTKTPTKNVPARIRSPRAQAARPDTAATRTAYQDAYSQRYGVSPTFNAKVNAQIVRFLERVPAKDAPGLAAFYVRHNRGIYVSSKHCVDLMLRDAEGLRTEWLSNRTVTETEARQADRTQANGNVWGNLLRKEGTHG